MPIAVAASRISDAARYSAGPGLSFCGRSSWRQRCQHGGGEKQRRNVAQQVAVLLRIRQRLNRHDAAVYDARPDGEPDETEMAEWIARRKQKADAEREVDANDHLLVVGLMRLPAPAGRPEEHQGAERDADDREHYKCDS